ncbi:thymidine kinase [bacterium]|nr:thymidine kinase [bacterium]
MFLEPRIGDESRGWIEVIAGPMFSGKTEELLRRLRRAKIANVRMAIFKPQIDVRYGQNRIVSHDANYFPSLEVGHAADIRKHTKNAELVAIDETQFFDNEIIEVCEELALKGVRVICTGLDMDYLGKPFGPMPEVLAIANYITKIHAICVQCGYPATHSFRKLKNKERVMLGELESYEARCRKCFAEGMAAQEKFT